MAERMQWTVMNLSVSEILFFHFLCTIFANVCSAEVGSGATSIRAMFQLQRSANFLFEFSRLFVFDFGCFELQKLEAVTFEGVNFPSTEHRGVTSRNGSSDSRKRAHFSCWFRDADFEVGLCLRLWCALFGDSSCALAPHCKWLQTASVNARAGLGAMFFVCCCCCWFCFRDAALVCKLQCCDWPFLTGLNK